MDEKEFKALQATMPWRHVIIPAQRGMIGGQIKVVNKHDQEVDLLSMCRFLDLITNKLAIKPVEESSNVGA
jgi:hypothetical protein